MKFEVEINRLATTRIIVDANDEDEAYNKANEIAEDMDISQYVIGRQLEGSLNRL